jgi:hypothetical protein
MISGNKKPGNYMKDIPALPDFSWEIFQSVPD